MPDDRAVLSAVLTSESYRGWQRFAQLHGVTLSALTEALGRRLGEFDSNADLPTIIDESVSEARAIGAERRRRGRTES